jgi:lauroyl/myristoyl acyltransferase/mitochondrial fission protein ELM1
MSKDSIIDYLSCILIKVLGVIVRSLPIGFSLFLGARLGILLYYFDLKHKAIAYSNLKVAFGDKFSPEQLRHLTREFYRSFGHNLIEIFFIPLVDKEYMNKYISIEGLEFVEQAFKTGKGVILLGVHSGSWELSNVICANLGFNFNLIVRDQRHPRLNELLNRYRMQKGCKILQRENQTRYLLEALKKNEAIGMTIDQGGKTGELVKFFGKDASMATGAIRLALKYDSVILPAYYTRVKGPYIKTIIEPPFRVNKTQDIKKDIHDNLQELTRIFEKNIARYAKDYLWYYKIWKYTAEKNILVLSDGKTGHLRQSQAVAEIVGRLLKDKGMVSGVDTIEINFKSALAKKALVFSSGLSGKYTCQGCLWCLRTFLQKGNYKSLTSIKPDIIISCGEAIAPINYVLSRENNAKSIVIMRPSILSTRRFDLVIMPKHDHPPKRKNILATQGALNLIEKEYLREQSHKLIKTTGFKLSAQDLYMGLLIGGDAKRFHLTNETLSEVIRQIKSASEKLNADILVTTSRRTSKEGEELVKNELENYPRCKLLVIANENNIPEAVGGIVGLSEFIICSSESISMISEAVNSQRYVLVFKSPGLRKKHKSFLYNFAKNTYIYLTEVNELSKKIEDIWQEKPAIPTLSDNLLVSGAIKKIL